MEFKIESPSLKKQFLVKRCIRVRGWFLDDEGNPAEEIVATVAGRRFLCRIPEEAAGKRKGWFEAEIIPAYGFSGVEIEARPVGRPPVLLSRRLIFCTRKSEAPSDYIEWVKRYDTLTPQRVSAWREAFKELPEKPLVSVVMPVWNCPAELLSEAIESVREQLYERWELCIADDASSQPHVRTILEAAAAADRRIKVHFRSENGHISRATNDAIQLATGEWIAFMDHDDVLPGHALGAVMVAASRNPAAGLFYSDEDKLDQIGRRCDPFFKPDWNPDLFLGQNFLCHLVVCRRELVVKAGGIRPGFEGSQDWDFLLRITDQLDRENIVHIPRILYHWRKTAGSTAQVQGEKPYHIEAARRAVEESLARRGESGLVERTSTGYWRVRRSHGDDPSVCLIIPTRNRRGLLECCVDSLFQRTRYKNFNVMIIDNGSDESDTLNYLGELRKDPRVFVLRDDGPFNYSRLNNAAVGLTDAAVIGLVNNDIEVINEEWLDEMVSHVVREEIGAVGAKLLFPNEIIQHAGVVLGIGGVAGHLSKGRVRYSDDWFSQTQLVRNVSGVTGACLLVKRRHYLEVGGLNEAELPVAFNDVDFCLKLQERGLRNLYTPFAELYHHESPSRGADDTPEKLERFRREIEYMTSRWGEVLQCDPAWNPNLGLEKEIVEIAFPPRAGHFDFLPQ